MSIRLLVALPLAALALAPVAADARDRSHGGAELQRQLEDPQTQDAVGTALGSLLGALLGMKAEPLAKMMDAAGDHDGARQIPRGATLGDLIGPDAQNLPRQIKRQVPGMMGAMGSMVGTLDELAPKFEQIGKQFERDMRKTH